MKRNIRALSIWSILVCIGGAGVSAAGAVVAFITINVYLATLVFVSLALVSLALAGAVEVSLRRSSRLLTRSAEQQQTMQRTAGSVGRLSPIVRDAVARAALNRTAGGQVKELSKGDSVPETSEVPHDRYVRFPEKQVVEIRRPTADEAPSGHDTALAEMLKSQGSTYVATVETRTQFLINNGENVTKVQKVGRAGWSAALNVAGASALRFDVAVNLESNVKDARAAIIWCRIYDSSGNEILTNGLPQRNDKFGSWTYLATSVSQPQNIKASLPQNAHSVRFGIIPWKNNTVQTRNAVGVTVVASNSDATEFRKPKQIRVAAILDDFSYESFRYECDLRLLEPSSWRRTMQSHAPDLLFVESAWAGPNQLGNPWRGRVYASERFGHENRNILLEILDYCSAMGIPTAFWNKEDPSHYEDKAHNFVETALLFDHIFTTDAICVDRYKTDYGHDSVTCLPFGVQPRNYNPIATEKREEKVVFAGAWYENHEERSEDMRAMFNSVIRSPYELEIRDRFYGSDDLWRDFPSEYQEFIRPSVPHNEVAQLFKSGAIGMTINTVTDSPTMFARRIFELMASNTFVVSNYSRGVEEFFQDRILFLDKNPNGLEDMSLASMAQVAERNLVDVLSHHTYERRFQKVLDTCMIEVEQASPTVTIVIRVDSLEDAVQARDQGLPIANEHGYSLLILLARTMRGTESSEVFGLVNGGDCLVAEERLLDDRTIDISSLITTDFYYYCFGLPVEVNGVDMSTFMLHAKYYPGYIVIRNPGDLPYSLRRGKDNENYFASVDSLKHSGKFFNEKALVYAV